MPHTDAQSAGLLSWSQDVRAAMKRLDPTQSRIIRMLYFERRTEQQVADELELPRQTVARSASAGMQALTRQILGSALAVD